MQRAMNCIGLMLLSLPLLLSRPQIHLLPFDFARHDTIRWSAPPSYEGAMNANAVLRHSIQKLQFSQYCGNEFGHGRVDIHRSLNH